MTNETDPGTVEACPFCDAAMSHCSDKDGEFWMHPGTVTDGDCFMSGQGIFLRQLTAWNTRAAQSQPAATVQEVGREVHKLDGIVLGLNETLMLLDREPPRNIAISRDLRQSVAAIWQVRNALLATPSKAVEPAPEQGEEAEAAALVDWSRARIEYARANPPAQDQEEEGDA